MRRSWIIALVIALVLVAAGGTGAALVLPGLRAKPDPVARQFLDAWSRGDYAAMRALVSLPPVARTNDPDSMLTVPRRGAYTVRGIYSDFRYHDLGEAFYQTQFDGSVVKLWRTSPLWGVAVSAPYLHDGRAPTLEAAILAHGGEAKAARDAYDKLGVYERGAVHLFLTMLDRPHHLELKR